MSEGTSAADREKERLSGSVLSRMKRGAGAALSGMGEVWKDREVRRTYRLILLALFALSFLLNLAGSFTVWHLTQPAEDASSWVAWGWVVVRVIGWLIVLLISPLIAITTCNLVFPVFSEIPFFAGLKSMDAARGAALEKRPGLGNAVAIANSLRRFAVFLLVTAGCFLLGLVPVVGAFCAPLLQFYFTAKTIGWELMDPYFDRVGLSWAEQKRVVSRFGPEMLGMGAVCAPVLSVPFVGPLFFGLVQAGAARFVTDVLPAGDRSADLVPSAP